MWKFLVGISVLGMAVWNRSLYPGTLVGPVNIGKLSLDLSSMEIQLLGHRSRSTLIAGKWATEISTLSPEQQPRACAEDREDVSEVEERPTRCIEWPGLVRLYVTHDKRKPDRCFRIRWSSLNPDYRPQDCYSIKGAHWYGGAEVFKQLWPMNEQMHRMQPYSSGDFLQFLDDPSLGKYGPVLEPYWISSKGVGIHVDSHVSLHASFNHERDQKLCLRADPIAQPPGQKSQVLSYNLCYSDDVKEIHRFMSQSFIDRPRDLPDERVFRSPIWSTWAQYKIHVNQSKVLDYARDIRQHGFKDSQIEIDDMYTTAYGDFVFDSEKFPQPKQMVDELKSMGFRVTSWVTPFANTDSEAFKEGTDLGYFIKDPTGRVPALVWWWQGIGAALDVTNPDAVSWYVDRLQHLRDTTGIDSYKFDAGEINYLPPVESSQTYSPMINSNDYNTQYAEVVASLGKMVEMRSGYRAQRYPIFMRMLDKDSRWGYDNGLKTMITTALQMGIAGYPFILPDMIGGNGYDESGDLSASLSGTVLPEKELFIRWAELNAYLPSMQYSIGPWQYDQETIDICIKYTTLHEEEVTPIVLKAAKEAVRTGSPIIRPLWWIAPKDEQALTCDSQFLVGDYLLVAPITDKGARMRDIYLPKGEWQDQLRGDKITGPKQLRNYKIDLSEIATFKLVK